MTLPTPSISQPRIHLWRPPALGTTVIEQHGAFFPMIKPYVAGTTPFTAGVNNYLWTGYGFNIRLQNASQQAQRTVDDFLASAASVYGLGASDTGWSLAVHTPRTGVYDLMSNTSDSITGSYRSLDRTPYVANGVAGYEQIFDPSGYDFFGLVDARLTALSLPTPGFLFMDHETDRPRCYDAVNDSGPGNWPGIVADARHNTETILPDLTGMLTPALGHATARNVDDLDATYTWTENQDFNVAGNLAASRLYERDSMAVEDSAMGRACYQYALSTWPSIRVGNYDVAGFTNAVAPYRWHGSTFGYEAYAAAAIDRIDLSCPVMYAFAEIMDNDPAVWTQGWTGFSPSQDALQLMKLYADAIILGAQATSGDTVMWFRAPGSPGTQGGSNIWEKDEEYTIYLLTKAFLAKKFSHFIHWSWDEDYDPELTAWCVDKAAARVGISW